MKWFECLVKFNSIPLTAFVFASPGLVCMKSSSSVVELVMLLCSQASLYLHPPPLRRSDLSGSP